MQLRDYQKDLIHDIHLAWADGAQNVCAVMPTGAGKTVVVSDILASEMKKHPVCTIAHRMELVGQMSLAIARQGVRHAVIGPKELVRFCVQEQMRELGTNFYNPTANCTVVSVDTLLARQDQYVSWGHRVGLWVTDEAHHIVGDPLRNPHKPANKWGKVTALFPNARGLGVTATPCRADGKGLGRGADGLMDVMVEGPTMRELIDQGFLCDYRIVCPESDLKMLKEDIGATGDYSLQKLKAAAKRSHITGDVVTAYRKFALGKRTIVFATDVETASEMAKCLQADGHRAEVVTGETDTVIRSGLIQQFRAGALDILVNVDLFGEGFDVPAVECVIMARPTESYGYYCQAFGRALRILLGKQFGLIIDMVGNVRRHGLPDAPREWSLWGRDKAPRCKNPDDTIPQTHCIACSQPFPRYMTKCKWCGTPVTPAGRTSLAQVDGDLHELPEALLRAMRGEAQKALESPEQLKVRMRAAGASELVVASAFKQRQGKLANTQALQSCIAWWAQEQFDKGRTEREVDKMFYLMFGEDRYTAVTHGSEESLALAARIIEAMGGPRV